MDKNNEIQTKEDLLKAIGESMLWLGRAGYIVHYMSESHVDQTQAEQDWEEMRAALIQLFSAEELTTDETFDTNLKLLYTHFGGKMGRVLYEARLREFFPDGTVHALTAKVYSEVTEKLEQFARAFLMQRASTFSSTFFQQQQLSNSSSQRMLPPTGRNQGTKTWLVPCPGCGTEKRVDRRTKRFRCKCGFDKPFPFSEQ